MRWKPSLRGPRPKDTVPVPAPVQIQAPVHSPDEENRRWWHNEIKVASDVLSFLTSGFPLVTPIHIQSLQQATTFYLSGFQRSQTQPLSWDDILNSLISKHAVLEFPTWDVAVIACLHAISLPAATRHVLSLVNFEPGRYLRCITLAARIHPSVVSHIELQSVECLLQLNFGQGRDYEDFRQLLEGPGMAAAATFLRPSVIQGILAQSGVSNRLNSQLRSAQNPKQITSAISMIDSLVRTGDASCCNTWLAVLSALDCQATLSEQMDTLVKAISVLSSPRAPRNDHNSTQYMVDRLLEVLPAAQAMFSSQLETGIPEYIGMLIYELGHAVQQATWMHQDIPPSFLSQVQRFPSQRALEAIFEQLQDLSGSSDAAETRLRSYLASSLGSTTGAGTRTMAVAAIREEVEFWKHPPDTVRADFARALSKFQNLDYSLYTACLLAMLEEDDEFIGEIKCIVSMDNEEPCLKFSNQLAHRRQLNQLQDNCWLMLLDYMVRKQDRSYLPKMAASMSLDLWLTTIRSLANLFGPMRNDLSQSGNGLTRDRLDWWDTLQPYTAAIRSLLEIPGRPRQFTWIFFPESQDRVLSFLLTVHEAQTMTSHRNLLAYLFVFLESDGSNLEPMINCIFALKRTSPKGKEICERVLLRKEGGKGNAWPTVPVTLLLAMWIRRPQLQPEDKAALEAIRKLMNLSPTSRFRSSELQVVCNQFQTEYEALIERARELESLRFRMQYQNRTQLSSLLEKLEIEDTSRGRAADSAVPDELLDSVELVGDAEYEISFLLTGLDDLQRQARGVPATARVLLLRLNLKPRKTVLRKLQKPRQLDINFHPSDQGSTAGHGLFKRYLVNNLGSLLSQDRPSVKAIHSATEKLINDSPSTCLSCGGAMSVKLWKASTCSVNCTNALRKVPLEIRLHQLLVDPSSIDLLLTSVYHAAIDTNLKLLPGCPVPKANIRAVIDSFPPLAILQSATDLQAAIRGSDTWGNDREKLLSWICLRFRGFMLSAPDGFRIPSMPHTQQFLLPNFHHEREHLFNSATAYGTGSGVVFHGTQCSRLFSILTDGLRNMSGTEYQMNGAASGPGVYCADEQYTSWSFSGTTGQSWRHSALSNMQVMLGCELKGYTASGVHVIKDDTRLLVRYVFLLPPGYQTPVRAHVEPAMSVAFAKLRSGLLT